MHTHGSPLMHTESFNDVKYTTVHFCININLGDISTCTLSISHSVYLVHCVITLSSIYQKMPRGIPALFVNLLVYVQTKSALDIQFV